MRTSLDAVRRMGLFDAEGHTNNTTLQALSKVYAGQLFDELCDFYQDYSMVRDDLGQLFSAAKTADARQRFLLICLQYGDAGRCHHWYPVQDDEPAPQTQEEHT